MKYYIALVTVLMYTAVTHAYLAQVENATSGTIDVRINLATCAPIDVGTLKPGEMSKIFDTGACCFDSISATGITAPIMDMKSGTVRPWGTGWLCFQNIHFTCYEMKAGGKVTGIGFQHRNLAK
jgi:hypothetical protein